MGVFDLRKTSSMLRSGGGNGVTWRLERLLPWLGRLSLWRLGGDVLHRLDGLGQSLAYPWPWFSRLHRECGTTHLRGSRLLRPGLWAFLATPSPPLAIYRGRYRRGAAALPLPSRARGDAVGRPGVCRVGPVIQCFCARCVAGSPGRPLLYALPQPPPRASGNPIY